MLEFNPGDLVVFSGVDGYSRVISLFQRSEYTHVGILVRLEDGELYLLESTTGCNIPDREGVVREGVSIRTLRSRILNTRERGERIWIARRRVPLDEKQEQRLLHFAHSVSGRSYDYIQAANSALDVFDSILPIFRNQPDMRALFCSELVAAAELFVSRGSVYHHQGYLLSNPSEVVPVDVLRLRYQPAEKFTIWGNLISVLYLFEEEDTSTEDGVTTVTTTTMMVTTEVTSED